MCLNTPLTLQVQEDDAKTNDTDGTTLEPRRDEPLCILSLCITTRGSLLSAHRHGTHPRTQPILFLLLLFLTLRLLLVALRRWHLTRERRSSDTAAYFKIRPVSIRLQPRHPVVTLVVAPFSAALGVAVRHRPRRALGPALGEPPVLRRQNLLPSSAHRVRLQQVPVTNKTRRQSNCPYEDTNILTG